jgi:chemotaxis protein methyltransferase CheR
LRDDRERERELPTLLDRIMICETSFFRNKAQFELLTELVLPNLISEKERTGSRLIRLWSAGCATGQEPYSLVICLKKALAERGAWTVRVLASDLSFTALERAESGRYRRHQVGGIGTEYLEDYFTEEGDSYRIKDFVRREVIFNYHNLKHDNGLRGLDVIFCRNVLIYFSLDEQRRVIAQLTRCLAPRGYLFLGHAESLQGLSSRFTMVHRNRGIVYRLDG